MKRTEIAFESLEARQLLASVSVVATQDNTLFQDPDGLLSNGAGEYLYIGKTNQGNDEITLRRGLLQFYLSSLPADAVIVGATLDVHVSLAARNSGPEPASLHRVLSSWGEASSDAGEPGGAGAPAASGDATWLHREFVSSTWNQPGGDFQAQSSGSINIDQIGNYSWSTDQMVSDVEFWMENPNQNFGWLIQGNESVRKTAKRIDSRENSVAANRPVLTIEYEEPAPLPTISIADASISEGNTESEMVFNIELSSVVSTTATVNVSTAEGSAIAGEDFVARDTTLTVTPNDGTSISFAVQILGDDILEDDETFTVALSSPNGVVLGTATATGTILNDDVDSAPPWQNAQLHEDVSGDGLIVPRDALLIINVLNGAGIDLTLEDPLPDPDDDLEPPPYLDVNGDGFVSPADALQVINWLNSDGAVAQAAHVKQRTSLDSESLVTKRQLVDQAIAALDDFRDELSAEEDQKKRPMR